MKTFPKRIAHVGAIAGFAALALLANPAVGSAVVHGSAKAIWSPDDRLLTVEFTNISSPTLIGCRVEVSAPKGFPTSGEVAITGNPGTGTYTSPVLTAPMHFFTASCIDADGVTPIISDGMVFNPGAGLGGVGGSVANIFGS